MILTSTTIILIVLGATLPSAGPEATVASTPALPRITSISYVEDPASRWTLADILKMEPGVFAPVESDMVHLGLTENPHWFRLDLSETTAPVKVVLELCNPRLGEVTLYTPDEHGAYRGHTAGVRHPFWDREIPVLAPAFPVQVAPGPPRPLFMQVRNAGSLRFNAQLWPQTAHSRHANISLAFAIIVAAGLMMMAVHKCLIYLHLRETGYLWIGLFLLACAFRQMTASAVANMFLWPEASGWARHAMDITSIATIIAGLIMANSLLRIWHNAPRWAGLNVALGLVAVIAGAMSLLESPQYFYFMLIASIGLPFSVTLYAIREIRNGVASAIWFLTSWGMVLAGALFTSMVAAGYLPSNLVTEHLLDVALLGAGLSWSFTLTYQLKAHQEEQREKLEAQVRDRTIELEDALDAVRTLRGLVPICSCCKKIRNDNGYWEILESYLRNHTEADFSHGLCPECAEDNYPAYFRRRNSAGD